MSSYTSTFKPIALLCKTFCKENKWSYIYIDTRSIKIYNTDFIIDIHLCDDEIGFKCYYNDDLCCTLYFHLNTDFGFILKNITDLIISIKKHKEIYQHNIQTEFAVLGIENYSVENYTVNYG